MHCHACKKSVLWKIGDADQMQKKCLNTPLRTNKGRYVLAPQRYLGVVAEKEGFQPSRPCGGLLDFESSAFDHSAISPRPSVPQRERQSCRIYRFDRYW